MFEPEAGGVGDADQPRYLGLLLRDHQLGQHVANTEDVEKWNLQVEWLVFVAILLYYTNNQAYLVWVPLPRSKHINSSPQSISETVK